MSRLAASLVALVPLTALVVAASCREATQITVEITTDVPCVGLPDDAGATAPPEPGLFSKSGRVALWLSDPNTPQTVARSCVTDGARSRVGTIAIVPSGENDERVSVTVAIDSKDPTRSEQCNQGAPSPDCIVARRTVGFIPHTPLTLPIHLSLACAGVVCDKAKGLTCVDGQCVSDGVDCTGGSCNVDAGVVDAGRIVDATPTVDANPGKCDGGGLGTAQNCTQCGFACAGTCRPWGCEIVQQNPLGTPAAEGCIAVTSNVVVWSEAKGGTGSVFWVPRAGTTWGTVEANVGVGPVAASSGFFSYVVRSPASVGNSYTRDLIAASPPSSIANVIKAQPGPTGDHPWVARGSAARCATTHNGQGTYGIDCELSSIEGATTSYRHIALGKASYLAINGATLFFGVAGAGLTSMYDTTLTKPTSVAAYGTADDYVVAAQNGTQYALYKVTVDAVNGKIAVTQKPFYSQPTPITGLRSAGTSIYFADDSKRIAKADYNGLNTQTAQVVVPIVTPGFTAMRGQVCLDVDDVAVYYLVDGVPTRAPK